MSIPNDTPLAKRTIRRAWEEKLPEAADGPCFMGIDPGGTGAIAIITAAGALRTKLAINCSEAALWKWLQSWQVAEPFATLEQITPRPTKWRTGLNKDIITESILRSSCLIYGEYCMMRAYLTAGAIPFEECSPQKWQKALSVRPRDKGETDGNWKGRLRELAQQFFPRYNCTLICADAILIAEYCRRKRTGTL